MFGGILGLNGVVWFPNVVNIGIMIARSSVNEGSLEEVINPPNWFFILCYLVHSSMVFLSPILQLYLIPDICNFTKMKMKKLNGATKCIC